MYVARAFSIQGYALGPSNLSFCVQGCGSRAQVVGVGNTHTHTHSGEACVNTCFLSGKTSARQGRRTSEWCCFKFQLLCDLKWAA